MPKVVHCKRSAEPFVYIGRPSIFGNPFAIGKDGSRSEVIDKYRSYFMQRVNNDAKFRAAVIELTGQNLGCWCAPQACHASVIIDWLASPQA